MAKLTKKRNAIVFVGEVTRNMRREPVWELASTVNVTRMDHSIGMCELVAELKDKKGNVIGRIDKPMGGIVFIVTVDDGKKGEEHESRQYAIDLESLCMEVYDAHHIFQQTPALPLPYPDEKKTKDT